NKILVINGLPGIGKSFLAEKYAKDYFTQRPNRVAISIDATTKESFDIAIDNIARTFDIKKPESLPEYQNYLQLIQDKMWKTDQNILLILDNLTKFSDVFEFIANLPNNVQILITSKNDDLSNTLPHMMHLNFAALKIKPLTKEAAIEYINQSLKSKGLGSEFTQEQKEKMHEAIFKVDSVLPIDLSIIDRAINQFPFSASFDMMMDYIPNNLTDHFKEIDVSSPEWKILEPIAYLSGSFISFKLLMKMELVSETLFDATLKTLLSQGYISDDNNRGIYIHEIIQNRFIEHTKLSAPESAASIISRLFHFFDDECPDIESHKDATWQKTRELLPHILKIIDLEPKTITDYIHKAHILEKMGEYCRIPLFDAQKAFEYYQKAHIIITQAKELGAEESNDFDINYEEGEVNDYLGAGYFEKEDYVSSMPYFQEAIKCLKKTSPGFSKYNKALKQIINEKFHLALALFNLGYTDNAKRDLISCIEDAQHFEKEHKEDIKYIPIYYDFLTKINARLGLKDEALESAQKALGIRTEKGYNNDNFELARSYSSLSTAYLASGEFDKAATNSKKSISILSELYKNEEEKPHFLGIARTKLAAIYRHQNKFEEAKSEYEKATKISDKPFDGYSEERAQAHYELGLILRNEGNEQESKNCINKAFEIYPNLKFDVLQMPVEFLHPPEEDNSAMQLGAEDLGSAITPDYSVSKRPRIDDEEDQSSSWSAETWLPTQEGAMLTEQEANVQISGGGCGDLSKTDAW
ncbi:MAG: tetratricopeptide repeat protein, partial [Rickettsiaceae bacterium]|nr:tetratricopeptide repeat protein [Rickettsiaceae bacterium]